jgi:hypothetical protein
MGGRRIRAVTHLDVSAAQIERALDVAREVFAAAAPGRGIARDRRAP